MSQNQIEKQENTQSSKRTKKVQYVAIGLILGAAVGTALDNIAMGAALGLLIGAVIDLQTNREN